MTFTNKRVRGVASVILVMATVLCVCACGADATATAVSSVTPCLFGEEAPDCVNGGVPVGDECQCPIYFTGSDCHERQCPHSVNGTGPHHIEPVNTETKFCDHCDTALWDGMHCQLCQSDAACQAVYGPKSRCNKDLGIKGSNKQFQCLLNSPYFIKLMGDGRNITSEVTLNCTSSDGGAFIADESKAQCTMAIYRLEPDHTYLDPFFRCEASACSIRQGQAESNDNDEETTHKLMVFRRAGQMALVAECALLACLGLVARFLPQKLLKRLTYGFALLIVATLLLFVTVMVAGLRSAHPQDTLVYECKHTDCRCAEDPPSIYQPICSQSDILANQILPVIKNTIRVECLSRTGTCQLTLADLALVFDVNCRASECVVEEDFPDPITPEETDAKKRQRVLSAIFALVPLSAVAVVVHWLYSRRESRRLSAEFTQIFRLADPRQAQQPDTSGDADASVAEAVAVPSVLEAPRGPEEEALSALQHHARRLDEAEMSEIRRLSSSPLELSVFDLMYTLNSRVLDDDRTVLKKVTFTAKSGEVLAIMGPSGAGKTTLLDLLSARSKAGTASGEILLNGTPVSATGGNATAYRNIIGYVSQEDTLLPALTVRQTIKYAAKLKLPRAFSSAMIEEITDRLIAALKLQQCEHTVVGDGSSMRGISGGEKRRVSIAVELVANPRILFLDEPTSGLDTVSAKRVIEAVVELAKNSSMRSYAPDYFAFCPIVIFSIHQPSQEIFSLFDKVLLLSDGVTVFAGNARDAAATLETRLKTIFGNSGVRIPAHADSSNDAEYVMKLEEILDSNSRYHLQQVDQQRIQQQLLSVRRPESDNVEEGAEVLRVTSSFRRYYANAYQQLGLLVSRAATCLVSSFHLVMCHAAVVACVGSLMCYLYQEQELDLPGTLNRVGGVSFLLLVTAFVSLSALEQLISERKLSIVERENCFYTTMPYLLSKILVDIIPLRVIPAATLASVIYFPMGFRVDNGLHFFWFVLIIVLFSVCMTLVILCIGIVTGSFGAAALLSSVFILWCFVFGGALVQAKTIPPGLQVFQSMSPFFLAFEPLMINELNGQSCMFSPTDETGKESAAQIPIMCVQYLANIGLEPRHFNSDIMQLSVYCFALLFLTWALLVVCSNLKR